MLPTEAIKTRVPSIQSRVRFLNLMTILPPDKEFAFVDLLAAPLAPTRPGRSTEYVAFVMAFTVPSTPLGRFCHWNDVLSTVRRTTCHPPSEGDILKGSRNSLNAMDLWRGRRGY